MAAVSFTMLAPSRGTSPNISPKRSRSPIKNLQCGVCLQSFNDARILPCLHSFCAECLEKSCLQYFGTSPSVYCPVCMDETKLSPKGIEGLPRNLYVKHLLELQDGAGNNARKCDLCTDRELATGYCQVCNYNLCMLCSHAHQRQRKTSQHNLVSLESMPPSLVLDTVLNGHCTTKSQVLLCKTHKEQIMSIYCESCSTPVCQKCTLTEHCGHIFTPLQTVARQQEDILRSLITRAKPFLVSLSDSLNNIKYTSSNVEERTQAVAMEICDNIDERMKALQEHKRSLLTELEAIKSHKLNTLHQQMEKVEEIFETVSNLTNLASTALKEHTSLSIFSTSKPAVISQLETLISSDPDLSLQDDDYIRYCPNSPGVEIRGIKMSGTLDSRGPSAANSKAEGEGLFEARQGQTATFCVTINDRFKQRRLSSEDKVECRIETSDSSPLATTLTELQKGVFQFSYKPETHGDHSISVLIEGKHIRSSPFLVSVLPKGRKHTGVFHCCSWCSSNGKKHVRCGCGSRMPGGYSGCGHGHPGHPGCKHWSCCGSRLENSDCTV